MKHAPSLLLLGILLLRCSAAVVGDAGSDYLDLKEHQLELLVDQTIANYVQKCELLATCDNPTNYSHDACSPLLGDKEGLSCMPVHQNDHCTLPGSVCTNMGLDFRLSYVREAETTNLGSVDTMLAVCSQRALDPLMREFASLNPSTLTRFYFASVDGTWRVLPGVAQAGSDCRAYEPRGRPYYRTATSVVKVVVVLIDLAASMNNNLPQYLGAGTILGAAKTIASQLLITLSAGDHVNILVFDGTRVVPLSPSAVLVQDLNATDPLSSALSEQTVEAEYKQSDFPGAILAALPNFESNPQAAKVILAITDGAFATLGNVTLPSANLTGVKLFLYKLPQADDNNILLADNNILLADNNILLAGNTLIQQLCAVGAHFEPILKNLENPLLAINKFFSYLANLKRILTGGRPQYSFVFEDFEKIGGNIITVSKPAFSAAGDLLGVTGITIYIELLGNLTNEVTLALQSRILASAYDASTAAQNEVAYPCGADSNTYFASNGGLCPRTDMTSTIQDIICSCGVCTKKTGNLHKPAAIVGIVVASVAGLVELVIAGCFALERARLVHERNRYPWDIFPGDRAPATEGGPQVSHS